MPAKNVQKWRKISAIIVKVKCGAAQRLVNNNFIPGGNSFTQPAGKYSLNYLSNLVK